ncbi:xylose isomerase [Photobacterium angustum]|uniref:xylose isomerase n=1 Tax=Photobacterium angustum TaxID=661 RepID=UPI0005DA729D|nr:xylose isomerase [Photobacterium angustum]KJG08162.1 xylose isomerase [Photobacterium angustum]PSV93641.1 xylose isomerase [Photobacterium angustum]
MTEYFQGITKIEFEGPESDNPLAFRFYQPDQVVLGKTMKEHLRFAACYWHNFCWPGADVFGSPTFDRRWQQPSNPLEMAKAKANAAFEFFSKLGVPYYCFHDTDVAPEGSSLFEYRNNFSEMVDILEQKQEETGLKLLWGTANAFSNPRYMSGAATNPNPEVFAYAASQISHAMEATKRLGGENYVLWGGREGYETLLNTDLRQERQQLGRMLQLVVEHKHKIGFKGAILIEPKPQEPTKHQYDYDVATVYGFLKQFGLENEVKVNIEANHATLAGHSFHHEIATAISLGLFGSIDANRGDPQLGWDTDQFPVSVEENTLVMYEILKAGGFTTGGLNFDAHVRRQSIDNSDLFTGHIGAMDVMAKSLLNAADLLKDDKLSQHVAERYKGWSQPLGQEILSGNLSLAALTDRAITNNFQPKPISGQQETLENVVNRYIYK